MCYNIITLKERRKYIMDKYKEYEARKKELQKEDLIPEEYEKKS